MSGVMLYYELATPVITNISDRITSDNFIEVQRGGFIVAKNEIETPVSLTIEYQKV
jgi:hypothetical protein